MKEVAVEGMWPFRRGRLVGVAVLWASLGAAVGAFSVEAQESPGAMEVRGGLYLFHHQPVDLEGADAVTEVYAAFLDVDYRAGSWRVFVQGRARDTRLRDFFPGNVWFQEAWTSYRVTEEDDPNSLVFRAGKLYRTLGRFWDGSFFGNIHYFDGLKLNPQFGLEAAGGAELGGLGLAWSSQLVLSSDRVSGAFPGRDFETMEGFQDRYGVAGRVAAALPGGVTLGASALSRRFEEPRAEPGDRRRAWRVLHLALDGEVQTGNFTVYGEGMVRGGGGLPDRLRLTRPGSEATYVLAGAQYARDQLQLRYNFSLVDYRDLHREEWIHQPGLTLTLSENVSGLVELDVWRLREAGGETVTTDRSLNLVLLLRF